MAYEKQNDAYELFHAVKKKLYSPLSHTVTVFDMLGAAKCLMQ